MKKKIETPIQTIRIQSHDIRIKCSMLIRKMETTEEIEQLNQECIRTLKKKEKKTTNT